MTCQVVAVYRQGMTRRSLAALVGNLILVGLIVIAYGLDWKASLWQQL